MGPQQAADGKFIEGPKSYEPLLEIALVSDWVNSYDSPNVKRNYLYGFKQFLDSTNKTPQQLLELNPQEAKQLIRRETQKIAQTHNSQAGNVHFAVKSFYSYHDKEIPFKRGEKIRRKRQKTDIERILDIQDVYKLADIAGSLNKRGKAIILCLFQSGVRSGCICNWNYGLVSEQLYPEVRDPIYLRISSRHDTKLSSQNIDYYYTFLRREAASALKEYIEQRKTTRNWSPKPDDPIFVSETGKPLKSKALWKNIKIVARLSGFDPKGIWPHTLRKSFRKVLNRTNIDEDTKESLMGHDLPGARGNYFDYHDVDEVARKYVQCDFSRNGGNQVSKLDAELSKANERIQLLEDQLKYRQVSEDQLDRVMDRLVDDPDFLRLLSRKVKKLAR